MVIARPFPSAFTAIGFGYSRRGGFLDSKLEAKKQVGAIF
jgi:hypothetical protein